MAGASRDLLLALEHDEGVAGVYRDRATGGHRLSASGADGGSDMTPGRFTFEGLRQVWVYGGFLPTGATRVVARDAHGAWSEGAAGQGVWLAITRAMPLAARFEDSGGAIVPRALEALEREPVPDATAPCAACGAAGWELALLAPADPRADERRAVACLRCGHRVAMGFWYAGAGEPMDPQPPEDWWRERAEAMRRAFGEAGFPVYGLATWEGERAWRGHGTSRGRIQHISLGHGGRPGVVVETGRERYPEGHARRLERALEQLITPSPSEEAWRRLSPAALTVAMEHDRLLAGQRVAAVVPGELAIAVDGRPRRFLAARCGDCWTAVTELDGDASAVLIEADGVPPGAVALELVGDIGPYLPGPPG